MKIKGKTLKGKNKIREAGTDEWGIVRESDCCFCLKNQPAFLIQPILEDSDFAKDKSRWVLQKNDPDFDLGF